MTPEQKELIREGEVLEKVLSGSKRGDSETMSDAIRYLIRVNRTQQYSEFVTADQCLARMNSCPGANPKPAWNTAKALSVCVSVSIICGTLFAIFV